MPFRVLIACLVLAAATLAGRSLFHERTAVPPLVFPVTVADEIIAIEATGQLEPETEHLVTIPSQFGKSTIEEVVDEGTRVKKGDPVTRLSTFGIEEQERNARQELLKKEAELKRMEREHALARAEDEKKVRTHSDELAYHRRALEFLEAGPDGRQLDVLALKIERARNEERHLTGRLKTQEELKTRGYLSELDYEAIATDLTKSRLDLAKQENLTALQKEGPREEERRRARAMVEKHVRDLELAEKSAASQELLRKLAIDKKQVEIKDRQTAVDERSRQRKRAVLVSPIDGVVLYANTWGVAIAVGAPAYGGMGIIRVVERGKMRAKVQVNERWIDRVKVGQDAVVKAANRPESYPAKVIEIARLAQQREDNPKSPRDFAVTLELSTGSALIWPSMSCVAKILVARHAKVSRLPLDVVKARQGKTIRVTADRPSGAADLSVTVLDEGPDFVYVRDLAAGERLVF